MDQSISFLAQKGTVSYELNLHRLCHYCHHSDVNKTSRPRPRPRLLPQDEVQDFCLKTKSKTFVSRRSPRLLSQDQDQGFDFCPQGLKTKTLSSRPRPRL